MDEQYLAAPTSEQPIEQPVFDVQALAQSLERAMAAHRFMDRRAMKGDMWRQRREQMRQAIEQNAAMMYQLNGSETNG